jgi:hypothetical protein
LEHRKQQGIKATLHSFFVSARSRLFDLWEAVVGMSAVALLVGGGSLGDAQVRPASAPHLVVQSADMTLHIRIAEKGLVFTPSALGLQGFQFDLRGNEAGRYWPSVAIDLIPKVEDEVQRPRTLGVVVHEDSANEDTRRSAGVQTFRMAKRQYFHFAATEGEDAQVQLGHGYRQVGGARLETTDFVDGWLSLVDLDRHNSLLRAARSTSPNPLRVRIRDEDGYRDPEMTP